MAAMAVTASERANRVRMMRNMANLLHLGGPRSDAWATSGAYAVGDCAADPWGTVTPSAEPHRAGNAQHPADDRAGDHQAQRRSPGTARRACRPARPFARRVEWRGLVVAALEVAEDPQDRQEQVEDAQVDAHRQHDRIVDA